MTIAGYYDDSAVEVRRIMPSYVGAGAGNATIGSTMNVAVPSGVIAGDLLVAVWETVAPVDPPTAPSGSGWTFHSRSGDDATTDMYVFYRFSNGSEPSNYTFTSRSGDHIAGFIFALRNVDPDDPFFMSERYFDTSAVTSRTLPAISSRYHNSMGLYLGTNGADTASAVWSGVSSSTLANFGQRFAYNTATGNGGGLIVATGEKALKGSLGTVTFTTSASRQTAYRSIAVNGRRGS